MQCPEPDCRKMLFFSVMSLGEYAPMYNPALLLPANVLFSTATLPP
jgi:hypothetical protein